MPDFSKHRQKTSKLVKKVGSHAVTLQESSTKHASRYLARRVKNIGGVKRFLATWLLLVIFVTLATGGTLWQVRKLSQVPSSVAGGTYTEGLVGSVNSLNPLFSSGAVDDSAARLMFNGLLRYDINGNLAPDIAKDWRVDETRKTYFVTLRDDVRWHDGQFLDAEDVVYTITAIQNTETRSPLFASWQGVKVSAANRQIVKFELTAPTASFPTSLTVAILPKHLLEDVPPSRLRTTEFNSRPIGTGPFAFSALRNERIKNQQVEFRRNEQYFRGRPQLDRFIVQTYADNDALRQALSEREITAAVDLDANSVQSFAKDTSIRSVEIPLNSGVFAFLKTTAPILSDTNVRRALMYATDRQAILQLFKVRYSPLKTPLLPSQLGYDKSYSQPTNVAEAQRLLDGAGWVRGANGQRSKEGVPLELDLTTADSGQYGSLAAELQKQWAKIGVGIKPQLLTAEQLQQTALAAHSYDILLYGIAIGSDPDVYAFWHSSQARPGGLNFSEWKSSRADASLEAARTRLEPVLRTARYRTFQDEWLKSVPAIALYQPRLNYSYHQNAQGFRSFTMSNAADRLTNVEQWTVNTRNVLRTP